MRPPARVLIADDEEEVADLVCQFLEIHGFEVESVGDGRAAIDRALLWRPDLAVVDLMMPEVDGFQVCRALRANSATANVGLIVLTGVSRTGVREEALAAGADRLLLKPFDPAHIVHELDDLLRGRPER